MGNKAVIDALKVVLADSYTLYLKTQNYHWNVTGPNFKELHSLFEVQYHDLFRAVDDIAERIRALDDKSPGSFKEFDALRTIEEGDKNADAITMIKHLATDQETIVKTLKNAEEAANEVGDDGTVDLMIKRIGVHEKNHWMLESSL